MLLDGFTGGTMMTKDVVRATSTINGKPLAKGLITRSMAKQIQEELATSSQGEAKLLFTWSIMEHL